MTGWTADSTVIEGSGGPTFWTADGSLAGYVSDPTAAPSLCHKIVAAIPPLLTTTVVDATTILVRWLSIFNATTYELYRDGALIFAGSGNSYTDTGLTPGTSYSYTIKSYNSRAGAGPSSSPIIGTTPPVSSTRTYVAGGYVAVRPANIANLAVGGLPTAIFVPGLNAVSVRYNWKDIEPTPGIFTWTRFDHELAQCAANGVKYFVMIVCRTFDGITGPTDATNPMPTDLQAYADPFVTGVSGNTRYGYQGYRWSPVVLDRFRVLAAAIGAHVAASANASAFGGMATQETATGSVNGGAVLHGTGNYTINGFTGSDVYSAAGFEAAQKKETDHCANGCPKGRQMMYVNFLSGGGQANLMRVATYALANGVILCCPDLVTGSTGNANIVNNVYPMLAAYHAAGGATMAGVQAGEWNGSGVGDSPVNMYNLFNFGTSSRTYTTSGALDWRTGSPLNLDGIVFDYEPGVTGHTFLNDAAPIIAAHPTTFGTVTPA